jgi:type I restriction enzyme R subunit
MTPEQLARRQIDEQLAECGWIVQNADEMNISAGVGVAIREFPLKTGFADYMLYAAGKAIGVPRRNGNHRTVDLDSAPVDVAV